MSEYTCPCPSDPVSEMYARLGEERGVGPYPHAGKCLRHHGAATLEEVEDRAIWTLRVLDAGRRDARGRVVRAIASDRERELFQALRARYPGVVKETR